jgi:hypothetical protein
MVNSSNGARVWAGAGLWRQPWWVLSGTIARDLVIVSTLWAVAGYADWPGVALLIAPLGFVPSGLAYLRWQRRRLLLTATDITVEWGVVRTCSVRFPLHEIQALEERQTLLGMLLDYGDITIFSASKTLTFDKLHPFRRFVAAYQAYQQWSERWFEPAGGPFLPPPAPQGDFVIEGRVRR